MHSRTVTRGIAAAAVLLTARCSRVATSGSAVASPVHPHVAAVTNGRLPADVASDYTGDCELDNVTCKPDLGGSCTGDTSQTTFPSAIRVLVRTPHHASFTIESVPFESYVENVLPNEWSSSWDGDALKAGAVAVKSYAWYWHTHFGGYANGDPSQCFDVTDDQDFQVYRAGSAVSRTNDATTASWPVVARVGGNVLETTYRNHLTSSASENCGAGATGSELSQDGSQACIDSDLDRGGSTGNKFNIILRRYYYPGLQLSTARQLRTPDDFSFQQASSRAFFHSGLWTLSDGYGTTLQFGRAGDIPAVFDDGTGFAHLGYFRPSSGNWYVATASGAIQSTVHLGKSGDVPVQANYNGVNQPTVPAVYDPSTSTWTIGRERHTGALRPGRRHPCARALRGHRHERLRRHHGGLEPQDAVLVSRRLHHRHQVRAARRHPRPRRLRRQRHHRPRDLPAGQSQVLDPPRRRLGVLGPDRHDGRRAGQRRLQR